MWSAPPRYVESGGAGPEDEDDEAWPTEAPVQDVELAITGMTCASCANRIERKLNKLDGVTASVNYATEKAKVTYPGTVSTDELLADRRGRGVRRRAADAARRRAGPRSPSATRSSSGCSSAPR